MITVNGTELEFAKIGIFDTDQTWIHPQAIISTHEIIYVIHGNVHICENGTLYDLKKRDLLLMEAGKAHYGYKESTEPTSFYWLHFTCPNLEKLNLPRHIENIEDNILFKELLHTFCLPQKNQFCLDSICSHILSNMISKSDHQAKTKIACDIFEWTRINANASLSVNDIAKHFKYNPEHISRIIKKNYNVSLKHLINSFIINHANDLLCHSTSSIKEIASILNFQDCNSFVKFYKYHEHISPSVCRNKFYQTSMNKE